MRDFLLAQLRNIPGFLPSQPSQPSPFGRAPQGIFGVSPSTGGGWSGIDFASPIGIYNIFDLVDRIINWLIILASPILVIMILWGAFLIMTSGGQPEKIKQGGKAILWAAVGYAILLTAKGIGFIVGQLLF